MKFTNFSVGKKLISALFSKDYKYATYNMLHPDNVHHMDEIEKRYKEMTILEGKQTIPNCTTKFTWKEFEIKFFIMYLMIPLGFFHKNT